MTELTNFRAFGNRIEFDLDDQHFVVKYPDGYDFDRPYLDLAKEFPLALWANKVAFTKPDEAYVGFEVDDERLAFWKWIAQRVHLLDYYQDEDGEVERYDFRTMDVETGSDPNSLVPRSLPDQEYEGALISQSTGKESLASKAILEENGIEPLKSVFIEYSSRAATHKIDTREEFDEFFEADPERLWSNFNELQSTLQEYTPNYEPVTCFWEMAYVTMELPMAVHDGLKYIMVGSQLDTGEAHRDPEEEYTAFAEINQSYLFEMAYSEYMQDLLDVPIIHSSNVRPFTGFTCRLIVADRWPEFMTNMHNCLRPNTHNRWCGKCYKCCNAWVEFMACGVDPADAGLDHDVLIDNPHLAAENEDWGFSFPRYDRDELVWQEFGAKGFFEENVLDSLTDAQREAYEEWRRRQEHRVDEDEYDILKKYQGKYVEPVDVVIPEVLRDDMGRERTGYVPERMDPGLWAGWSEEWKSFKKEE